MIGQVTDFAKLNKKIPYQWRVQAFYPKQNPTTCQCVAYIDARDVMALLDDACGPENWQSDFKEVKGRMYGGVALRCGDDWVWKWDCGTESETEGEKGEASDAFKRAAVKWGIGRFLYDMGLQRLGAKSENGRAYPADAQGNRVWDLTKHINDANKTPAQRLGPFDVGVTMAEHEAREAEKQAGKVPDAAQTLNNAAKAFPSPVAGSAPQPLPTTGIQPNTVLRGLVRNVFSKTGPKKDNKGTYTRYSITMDTGDQMTTFSHEFGAIAQKSLDHGLPVELEYMINGRWKDVVKLALADEAQGQALEDSFMQGVQEPPPDRNGRWS